MTRPRCILIVWMLSLVINKQLWLFYYYYLFPWIFLLSFSIFSSFSLPLSPFIFFHYYCYYSFLSPFRPLSAAPRAGAGRHRSRRRGGSPGGIPTRWLSADTCRDRSARSAARAHPHTHRHTRVLKHPCTRARSLLPRGTCLLVLPLHTTRVPSPVTPHPWATRRLAHLPSPAPALPTSAHAQLSVPFSSPQPLPPSALRSPSPPAPGASLVLPLACSPSPSPAAAGSPGRRRQPRSRLAAAPSGRAGRSCSWC